MLTGEEIGVDLSLDRSYRPQIGELGIVYENLGDNGWHVKMCDWETGEPVQLTDDSVFGGKRRPDISGEHIVYHVTDYSVPGNHKAHVRLQNLSTGEDRPLTNISGWNTNARITGNHVVWHGISNITNS